MNDYIKRIPIIIAILASMITGTLNYYAEIDSKQLYLRMLIAFAVFFAVGLLIKDTFLQVEKNIKNDKATNESDKKETEDKYKGKKIDLKAEDDFSPLHASNAIKDTYLKK